MSAILVEKLNKSYKGNKYALNELSLSVKQGEIFTLLGQNGAGKSTLINILTTFMQPTSGRVTVLGNDLVKQPKKIRKNIACVAQKTSIDEYMTLKENMYFQSRLYGMDDTTARRQAENLITEFNLADYMDAKVKTFSGGVKRRLDIAMSMMSAPQILFLDEPTVGMDIETRKAMWDIVKKISGTFGTTVFLTTHYLEEADLLSDTICIIENGHELVQDTPSNLRQYTDRQIIKILLYDDEHTNAFERKIRACSFVSGLRSEETALYVNVNETKMNLPILNEQLLQMGIPFAGIECYKPSLDDVFLTITHRKERA